MRRSQVLVLAILGVLPSAMSACGSDEPPASPTPDAAPPVEAAVDAGPDAPPLPPRSATGQRIVSHAALLAGMTSDGYVIFSDTNAEGHSVAKVIALDGTGETTLATSSGTGKADLRFEIRGKVAFVWADRGNRVATLTIWSKATGAIAKGPNIRPGRAAASADGSAVAYMRDVTTETASIVAGPIAGAQVVIGTLNAKDDTCWRGADVASSGSATVPRLLAHFCTPGSTSPLLRSVALDGSSPADLTANADGVSFGRTRVLWHEPTGTLYSALPDGTGVVALVTNAIDHRVARDESRVVYLTKTGAILSVAPDGVGASELLVGNGGAKVLGSISSDGRRALFATKSEDKGTGFMAPYTDLMLAASGGGAGSATTVPLVTTTTTCVQCLYDAFTPDGTLALALDPVDNSNAAQGVGPLRAFVAVDGVGAGTVGSRVYTVVAMGKGSGTDSRFVIVSAAPAAGLSTPLAFDVTTRTLVPSDQGTPVARGAEQLALDGDRTKLVYSLPGSDELGGVWVAPLP